jgi:uncharacterized protein
MATMRCRAAVIILVAVVMTGCADAEINDIEPTPGVANPASEYCVEEGGQVEIREDAQGGEFGVCTFDDGSECEEWELYRGECQPGQQP